jgi:hypothetical protein
MEPKTKGKCPKCGKMFAAAHSGRHLLACALQSDTLSKSLVEGYLIRISSKPLPEVYWIFATVPKNASLASLDQFLRDIWLECCGHMSAFFIGDENFSSCPESGEHDAMEDNTIGQLFSPGMTYRYVYDMGSSTELRVHVVAEVNACPQDKVTLLMRNDPPILPCDTCEKKADTICSFCSSTICSACRKNHSCSVNENDDYMLMPLVNSPRAGVCGYVGAR